MSLCISKISPAKAEEWDATWTECNYSTYFHSREWAEIWETYTKGAMRPAALDVKFSDGTHVILPLSYTKSSRGLFKNYVSSPAGTYGGWISKDKLLMEHGVLLAEYLTKKLGNVTWRMSPYDELAMSVKVSISIEEKTHVINLEKGFESIYGKWTKGHSSAARKARKAGVKVEPASSLNDWRAYYQIYEDSLRRWGEKVSTVYSWDLFSSMFERNSPNIKLWLSLYEGETVAGGLIFYAKKHVVYWHGAALDEYFNLRPVNLLMYEVIKDACEKGYAWFDFNPSGGHEGVKAFKKSFGAESMPCPVMIRSRTLFESIRGMNH